MLFPVEGAEGKEGGPPRPDLTADQRAVIQRGQARGRVDQKLRDTAVYTGAILAELGRATPSGDPARVNAARQRAAELLAQLEAQAGQLKTPVDAIRYVAEEYGVRAPEAGQIDPSAPTELQLQPWEQKFMAGHPALERALRGQPNAPAAEKQASAQTPRGSPPLEKWEKRFITEQPLGVARALVEARQGKFNAPRTAEQPVQEAPEEVAGPAALISPKRIDATRERLPWEDTQKSPPASEDPNKNLISPTMGLESRSVPERKIRAIGLRQLVEQAAKQVRRIDVELARVDLEIDNIKEQIEKIGKDDQLADLRQLAPLGEALEALEGRKTQLKEEWLKAEADESERRRHAEDMERIAQAPE